MKGLKIRVPDAPAYLAFPKSLGANPTPIAFAEVYLALQNGTVDAQENPLPTIEAKKFFEVQKNISLTGHIVDSLLTVVSRPAVGQADRGREEDLHRRDAGSRRKSRPTKSSPPKTPDGRVQEEGQQRDHGRQERLPRSRAQDHQAHGSRISPSRITTASWPSSNEASGPGPQHGNHRRHAPRHGGDGQFHAQDEAVDLSGTASRPGWPWASSGSWALTVFYQFFTRYVMNDSAAWTEEIARYLLIAMVFTGATIGVVKNNHIQVDFFYRFMPRRHGARHGHRWSTCCASASSPPRWC